MENKKKNLILAGLTVTAALILVIVICVNSKAPETHYNTINPSDIEYTEFPDVVITTPSQTEEDENSVLAKSCQKIISTGRDKNGDIYEIVANIDETYHGSNLMIGVVKNGKWLIEPNNECPYINTDRWGWDTNGKDIDQLNCGYLSNGTFYNMQKGTTATPYSEGILDLWNVEHNQHLYLEDILLDTGMVNSYHTKLNSNDKLVLIQNKPSGIKNSITLMFLDTESLETENIYNVTSNSSVGYYTQIKEGLFYTSIDFVDKEYVGTFYNENGEKVFTFNKLNMNDTQIISVSDFNDGQCEIINQIENGTRFKITIDKEGNLLNQEKLDNE